MITKRNLKVLLETIGFELSGDGVGSKAYGDMLESRLYYGLFGIESRLVEGTLLQ
jgi:hypothetical protein